MPVPAINCLAIQIYYVNTYLLEFQHMYTRIYVESMTYEMNVFLYNGIIELWERAILSDNRSSVCLYPRLGDGK